MGRWKFASELMEYKLSGLPFKNFIYKLESCFLSKNLVFLDVLRGKKQQHIYHDVIILVSSMLCFSAAQS